MMACFKDIPIGGKFRLFPVGSLVWTKINLTSADVDGLPGTRSFIPDERSVEALTDNEQNEEIIP